MYIAFHDVKACESLAERRNPVEPLLCDVFEGRVSLTILRNACISILPGRVTVLFLMTAVAWTAVA